MSKYNPIDPNEFYENLTSSKGDFDPHDGYFEDFIVDGSTYDDEHYMYDGEELEFVVQEGGDEGGAEYCFTIFKLKDSGRFIRIAYSYHSYDGYNTDYASFSWVKPVERMVTFYE